MEGADPVIWYSFGITHFVRPEDFPVMPCETVGFHLKPFGFFSVNPGVDLAPETNAASKLYANGHAANGNGHAATNGNGSCCETAAAH